MRLLTSLLLPLALGQSSFSLSSAGGQSPSAPYNPPLIGVNLRSAAWGPLSGADPSLIRAAASAACTRNMTFVRFPAGPQYPDGAAAYLANETQFWATMDAAFGALLAVGCVDLMPTLFHNPFVFSDLSSTPLALLAKAARNESKNVAAWDMHLTYIDKFVRRYSSYPSIVAWELTHELNLLFDMPLSQSLLYDTGLAPGSPWLSPANKTPTARLLTDSITTRDGMDILKAWAAQVRAADPQLRPVSAGHAVPRVNAEALRLRSPDAVSLAPQPAAADSLSDFLTNLNVTHSGFDWVSLHLVPNAPDVGLARWGAGEGGGGVQQVLQWATAFAANASKMVLLGQFGAPPSPGSSRATPRALVNDTVAALQLLAVGADADAAVPGQLGLVAFAALANWMEGGANSTALGAVWPDLDQGVVAAVQAHDAQHTETTCAIPGECCKARYLQAYQTSKALGLLDLSAACTAQIQALTQQNFGPPVSFDVFTVMCKGACRRYSAAWRVLQAAAAATSCDCGTVFDALTPGGHFWCPRSPADQLCRYTGWCFDANQYENYTCSAGACGRWETSSEAYNKARSACGVNYDGAAATALSLGVAALAVAIAGMLL